ncbi:MAG: glycosyltransferase family 87 protein [Pseudomonadota bacterium]
MQRSIIRAVLWALAALAGLAVVLFYATWIWTSFTRMAALPPGTSANMDFAAFWAAAKIGLAGDWVASFDRAAFAAAMNPAPGTDGARMLWLYPPGFMAVLLPFGALSFTWAWIAFGALSIGVFAAALLPLRQGLGGWFWAAMGGPAVLVCLSLGQTALLFAGMTVLVIEALRHARPVRAGLWCALLTLKPQLVLAIGVALLAGRHWRAIVWAAAGGALIVGLTLIYPGLAYWQALAAELQRAAALIPGTGLVRIMVTPFGTAQVLGDGALAHATYLAVAALALAALAWIWAQRDLAHDWKAAALCLATPLATPYALYYELVLILVAGVYLWRAAGPQGLVWRLWAGLFWALPVIGYYQLPDPGFAFVSPVLVVALAHITMMAWRGGTPLESPESNEADRSPPQPSP